MIVLIYLVFTKINDLLFLFFLAKIEYFKSNQRHIFI